MRDQQGSARASAIGVPAPSGWRAATAGSVEHGEQPEDAALRELFEETGIDRVEALERLRTLSTDLGAGSAILLHSVGLSSSAACREGEPGATLRRGLPVRVLAEEPSASLIRYEEFDYSVEPRLVSSLVSGWVPASALARSFDRVIFRARVGHDNRTSWQHLADGQVLEIFWLPLRPKPPLVAPQQAWLDAVYEQLSSV